MRTLIDEGLAAELERRCLRGLATAARALAGDDTGAVCATFASWRGEARRPWPWLPGLCYAALEDLGATFPDQDEAAIVLGRLLVAAEPDPGAVDRALAALPAGTPEPVAGPGVDAGGSLRRRTLLLAVDRFWADLAAAMRRVHEPVVSGDRGAADWIIVATRRQLQDERERIAELVDRVAQGSPGLAEQPPADEPVTAPEAVLEPEPEPEPEPESEPEPVSEPEAVLEPEPEPKPGEHHPAHDETELLDPAALAALETTGPIDGLDDPDATGPLEASDSPSAPPAPPPPGYLPPRAVPSAPRSQGSPQRPAGGAAGTRRPPPRPEDVEYRRVREHTYAPIVFVVLLVLVALIVLATVGPPPR